MRQSHFRRNRRTSRDNYDNALFLPRRPANKTGSSILNIERMFSSEVLNNQFRLHARLMIWKYAFGLLTTAETFARPIDPVVENAELVVKIPKPGCT